VADTMTKNAEQPPVKCQLKEQRFEAITSFPMQVRTCAEGLSKTWPREPYGFASVKAEMNAKVGTLAATKVSAISKDKSAASSTSQSECRGGDSSNWQPARGTTPSTTTFFSQSAGCRDSTTSARSVERRANIAYVIRRCIEVCT
jgi:hypothetical protein